MTTLETYLVLVFGDFLHQCIPFDFVSLSLGPLILESYQIRPNARESGTTYSFSPLSRIKCSEAIEFGLQLKNLLLLLHEPLN